MTTLHRRTLLISAGVLAMAPVIAEAAVAKGIALGDDVVLGRAGAPVTVVEYASVGCPHCALWGLNDFPDFRKRYIDSGKVRFILREALTGDLDVAAAGFMLARRAALTGGLERYFQVVHDVYAAQPRFFAKYPTETPIAIIHEIGRSAGLSDAETDACLNDAAALKAFNDRAIRLMSRHHIKSTPTFVIGGVKLEGETSPEMIDAAIAKAMKHRRWI